MIFLSLCSASPRMREWKWFILSSSVSWLWIFRLVWNRSSNNLNFKDFPLKLGFVVVGDLGSFATLLLLLLKLAELLFVANFWRANSIWSASIVAEVFLQRNCGWLIERAFFWFPDEVRREQLGISSLTLVTMLWGSSCSELFRLLEW